MILENGTKPQQRKKVQSIRLSEEEYEILKARATLLDVSVGRFMRDVSLERRIKTPETQKAIADLGRLGGLFKLAITKDHFSAWRPEFQKILRLIQEAVENLGSRHDR